ncbi:MAG: hypothetical protein ACPGRU_04300, partial [Candidatus Puniceispirillaceae bacterium]
LIISSLFIFNQKLIGQSKSTAQTTIDTLFSKTLDEYREFYPTENVLQITNRLRIKPRHNAFANPSDIRIVQAKPPVPQSSTRALHFIFKLMAGCFIVTSFSAFRRLEHGAS